MSEHVPKICIRVFIKLEFSKWSHVPDSCLNLPLASWLVFRIFFLTSLNKKTAYRAGEELENALPLLEFLDDNG